MRYFCVSVLLTIGISGCVTKEKLEEMHNNSQFIDDKAARKMIAEHLDRDMKFGSLSILKQKLIDAKIGKSLKKKDLFSDSATLVTCVSAYIENPLFPIHQPASAHITIFPMINGKTRMRVSSSSYNACSYTEMVPFPELEEVRQNRLSR